MIIVCSCNITQKRFGEACAQVTIPCTDKDCLLQPHVTNKAVTGEGCGETR